MAWIAKISRPGSKPAVAGGCCFVNCTNLYPRHIVPSLEMSDDEVQLSDRSKLRYSPKDISQVCTSNITWISDEPLLAYCVPNVD